jgi:hypothetical protein
MREEIKRLFGPFNILSYSWTKSTHTHLFFSSPAALAGPESGIFKFLKNLLFLPFFYYSTLAGMFF